MVNKERRGKARACNHGESRAGRKQARYNQSSAEKACTGNAVLFGLLR